MSETAKTFDEQLHIYPQAFEHCEALIIGTPNALRNLRDALDKALEQNVVLTEDNGSEYHAISEHFAADGEGYSILIKCTTNPSDYTLSTYTDDIVEEACETCSLRCCNKEEGS